MVVNKRILGYVWISIMELYLKAVGTSWAAIEMWVFLGLLGRCNVSGGATIRVVHRVVRDCVNGERTRVKAKVVGEFVSNNKVLALLSRERAAKERYGMHALIWNCGYRTNPKCFREGCHRRICTINSQQ